MRTFILSLALVTASLGFVGCATIFGDSYDSMTINSEPEGADVYWRGEHIGRTPFTYQFKRQTAASYLQFAKAGYEDKRIDLQRKIAGAGWLNFGFLTASPSSWGTDVSSGAMWEYAPKSYVAKLSPQGRQEAWNESVMEYVLANETALKKEISRGSGESLSGLCKMIKMNPERCQTFASRAKAERTLGSENALEFYRALRAVDIKLREETD